MKKLIYVSILLVTILLAAGLSSQSYGKNTDGVKKVEVTLNKNNTLVLRSPINQKTAANLVHKARKLDARLESNDPIFLVLNTPGGSIKAGLNMIENLRNMNRDIHTININSASMGFHVAHNLGYRLITRDGTLMNHKAWGLFKGEFPGELGSRYSHWLKKIKRMNKRVVQRTNGKQTLKSYKDLIEHEYRCDGKNCVKQGFADMLVKPTCDKSLSGTNVRTVGQLMFRGARVEIKFKYPECPINSGYLARDVFIDNQSVYGNLKSESGETFDNTPEFGEEKVFTQQQLNQLKKKVKNKIEAITSKDAIVKP